MSMNENVVHIDDSGTSGIQTNSFRNTNGQQKKPGDSNHVKFRNALQIHTKYDGYNSGRQYIIQTRSEEECDRIVDQLTKLSKTAAEQLLAKSQFVKAQASTHPYRA
jgi:hypothetical protein